MDWATYWYKRAFNYVEDTQSPLFFNVVFEAWNWVWFDDRDVARDMFDWAIRSGKLTPSGRKEMEKQEKKLIRRQLKGFEINLRRLQRPISVLWHYL